MQVPVGGLAAGMSRLVGVLPSHVRGVSHGHNLHCQLHQPDGPCSHVCRVNCEQLATFQMVAREVRLSDARCAAQADATYAVKRVMVAWRVGRLSAVTLHL